MLQQILQDMWVDPELLAELDDGQKQTLFCRMREEQVRRWTQWEKQAPSDTLPKRPKSTYSNKVDKSVGFLLGEDGEPWTWVMGDHENDRTIEEILEQEAREEARKQAEKEAQQIRKSVEAELTELLDLNQKQIEAMEADQRKDSNKESLDIYNTAEELKERITVPFPKTVVRKTVNNINHIQMDNIGTGKREALGGLSLNKPKNVSQRVALWEKKVMEERETEIFKRLQSNQKKVSKEAEEAELKQDELWRESERKAKEAEHQIREIARRARELHRRTSALDMEVEVLNQSPSPTQEMCLSPISMGSLSPTQRDDLVANPENKEAVYDWFQSCELERGAGLEKDSNQIAPWFHGLITRQAAELLLQNQPKGTFLVRVSEKIWGYAISYQDGERCKHYLIDAYGEHYQFFNHSQTSHNTLGDFIRYYAKNPITTAGYELLTNPCPRIGVPDIFLGASKGRVFSNKF